MFWKKEIPKPQPPSIHNIGDIIYESVDTFPKYPLYIYNLLTEDTEKNGVITTKTTFHIAAFVTEFHNNKIKFLCFKTLYDNKDIYIGPVPSYHDEKINQMIANYKDTGVLEFLHKPHIDKLNEEPEIYVKDDYWDCYIIGPVGKIIIADEVSFIHAETIYLQLRKTFRNHTDYECKSQHGMKRIYIPFSPENRLILEKSKK